MLRMMIELFLFPFRLVYGLFSCTWGLAMGMVALAVALCCGLIRVALPVALIIMGIRLIRKSRGESSEKKDQEFTSYYSHATIR